MTVFAIDHIARDDKVRKKLEEELEQKLPLTDFTYEQVKELEYLNAVVKECLRISSPANGVFFRLALVDTKIGHINIRKGDLVYK